VLAAVAVSAVAAPGAAFAASPPSLASSFTPATIPVGGTSALSFTITNPNASGSISGIAFTDTLPAGLVVDNPAGANGTCGSAGTLTAVPGSNTITLTGGKLAGGASCTVSAGVTSSAPGVVQNSVGGVTSGSGNGSGDTQSLTVAANPTVTLTSPKDGSTFDFGQKVIAHYSCAEGTLGPGLTACSGDADNGTPIDTSTAGPQTFSVSAISNDGAVVTTTVNYTVRPDNHFTVSVVKVHRDGSLGIAVKVPGPGKVAVLESAPIANLAAVTHLPGPGKGRFAFGSTKLSVTDAGTFRLTVKPTRKGTQLVRKHHTKVLVRLEVLYTPTGGLGRLVSVGGVFVTK